MGLVIGPRGFFEKIVEFNLTDYLLSQIRSNNYKFMISNGRAKANPPPTELCSFLYKIYTLTNYYAPIGRNSHNEATYYT